MQTWARSILRAATCAARNLILEENWAHTVELRGAPAGIASIDLNFLSGLGDGQGIDLRWRPVGLGTDGFAGMCSSSCACPSTAIGARSLVAAHFRKAVYFHALRTSLRPGP